MTVLTLQNEDFPLFAKTYFSSNENTSFHFLKREILPASKKPWKCLTRTPVAAFIFWLQQFSRHRHVWQILSRRRLFFWTAHFVRIGAQSLKVVALPNFCQLLSIIFNFFLNKQGSVRCTTCVCIIGCALKHLHRFHGLILHRDLGKGGRWEIGNIQYIL